MGRPRRRPRPRAGRRLGGLVDRGGDGHDRRPHPPVRRGVRRRRVAPPPYPSRMSTWDRIRAALRREKRDVDEALEEFEVKANATLDRKERELRATPAE